MSAEEWRTVAIAPDYEVSNLGRVRSLKYGRARVLRPGVHPKGYHNHQLSMDGTRVPATAHALVLAAFVGPRPGGLVVRHLDGNPANNALSNLAYGTDAENAADCLRHGRHSQATKQSCVYGHPFDEANTYVYPGRRCCRVCRAQYDRLRLALTPEERAARKAAGLPVVDLAAHFAQEQVAA